MQTLGYCGKKYLKYVITGRTSCHRDGHRARLGRMADKGINMQTSQILVLMAYAACIRIGLDREILFAYNFNYFLTH